MALERASRHVHRRPRGPGAVTMGILKRLTAIPVFTVLVLVEVVVWMATGRGPGWAVDPYVEWVSRG